MGDFFMKVIFLDIDGVLNTAQTFKDIEDEVQKNGVRRIEIDLKRVGFLKEIVEQTGAVLVLSSSWRTFGEMENGKYVPHNKKMAFLIELLAAYGLFIYDITPVSPDGIRQNEIESWMKNKDIESFIVIDDDSFDLQKFLHKELIKTSLTGNDEMITDMRFCTGLCACHVKEAIKKLSFPKGKP